MELESIPDYRVKVLVYRKSFDRYGESWQGFRDYEHISCLGLSGVADYLEDTAKVLRRWGK